LTSSALQNFSALADIFTEDAIAIYPAPLNVVTGATAIAGNLSYGLQFVTTQHALTTQIIDVFTEYTASATTYYTATHFGMGNFTGQYVIAFGKYIDGLVKTKDGWKINRRRVDNNMVSHLGPTVNPHVDSG
jgi:ketosteroid isomerase-like protein